MGLTGFKAPPEGYWKCCPYCMEALGKIEIIKRKKYRIITCKKCKHIIDERHIQW